MIFALDSSSLGMEVLLMSMDITVQFFFFLFYMLEDKPEDMCWSAWVHSEAAMGPENEYSCCQIFPTG